MCNVVQSSSMDHPYGSAPSDPFAHCPLKMERFQANSQPIHPLDFGLTIYAEQIYPHQPVNSSYILFIHLSTR